MWNVHIIDLVGAFDERAFDIEGMRSFPSFYSVAYTHHRLAGIFDERAATLVQAAAHRETFFYSGLFG